MKNIHLSDCSHVSGGMAKPCLNEDFIELTPDDKQKILTAIRVLLEEFGYIPKTPEDPYGLTPFPNQPF